MASYRAWTGILLTAATAWLLASSADAGVALSPMKQDVVVKPGGEAQFAITVEYVKRGPQDARSRIRLEVVDFSVSRDGTLSFGSENHHARSAVDWITLDAQEFVLEPGQARKVTAKVVAPLRADGDYWAAVLMTIGDPKHEHGVNVILRTASGVFVRAARRNYVPKPTISAVDVSLPRFDQDPPEGQGDAAQADKGEGLARALAVQADVTNTGLVGFIALGKASIYLDGRRKLATIPLYSLRQQILPGDERRFVGIMPAPLPAGQYRVQFMLEADSNAAARAFRTWASSTCRPRASLSIPSLHSRTTGLIEIALGFCSSATVRAASQTRPTFSVLVR
jgi:hypothetical protein